MYEFVKDRLAIDLLFGGPEARRLLESRASAEDLDDLWRSWQAESTVFETSRQPYLRYGNP